MMTIYIYIIYMYIYHSEIHLTMCWINVKKVLKAHLHSKIFRFLYRSIGLKTSFFLRVKFNS